MKLKIVLFLAMTVLSFSGGAASELLNAKVKPFCSGNQYMEFSEAKKSAYVTGVLDMALEIRGLIPKVPANVTAGQIADAVTKYLKDHPEKRHYTCASTVTLVFRASFTD